MPDFELENWNIQETWNDLVTQERPASPRTFIRASEMGKPFLDRYLAMKGVAPTNPFSPRVRRIFDCGNVFEEVVERMFRLLGILVDAQEEVKMEMPGMLPVIGHYDHKVGGKVQLDMIMRMKDEALQKQILSAVSTIDNDVQSYFEFMYPPEWLLERSFKLGQKLAKQYPQGMKVLIAEIKSVNSMAFWAHKNQDPVTGFFKGYDNHKLQLFTYLLATGQTEGRRFYVSKDDLTLMESPIHSNDSHLKKLWEEDVARMTEYFKAGKEPDKEPDIIFDFEKQQYVFNWAVARSPYLKYITGKDTVEDWEDSLREELRKKNTKSCRGCGKDFKLVTLNKNQGYCGKCTKKGGVENE